jgi:cytoskeleton protein RodZ
LRQEPDRESKQQMRDFGSSLRRERERRGITLEGISSSTKIRLSYLEAIEQDHLDQLPSGLIGRGFVRAYAREIGVDEEETIAAYVANRADSDTQLAPPAAPKPAFNQSSNLATRLPAWVFVAGFLVIGVGFVALGGLRNHYRPSREPPATQAVSDGSSPVPSQSVAGESSAPPVRSKAIPSTNVSPDREQNRAEPTFYASNAAAEGGALTLVINVRQDAWLSIIADGQRVMSDTLVAPSEKVVKARSQIVVRAGNIGAVDFSFNGETLPIQGAYGEARTLRFDARGLMPTIPKPVSPNPPTLPASQNSDQVDD